ncbi:MAG: thioredoxin family protein [Anaerolineales bacterium]|nr:thioredoxin family protein [Anaerolineales bacterium]
MAKPIVDGIEKEITDKGQVLRIDVKSELGQQLVRRYQVIGVPTVLVLDGKGEITLYQSGPPGKEKILDAVSKASSQ